MRWRGGRKPTFGDWIITVITGMLPLSVFVAPVRTWISNAVRGAVEHWGLELPWDMGFFGSSVADPLEGLPDSPEMNEPKAFSVREPERGGAPKHDRSEFGPVWVDEDHNGCDTRNDTLAHDLARSSFEEGMYDCVVLKGSPVEPYMGQMIEFQRGQNTSSLVQTDHVAALGGAWRSGAWQWDAAPRQSFANDPLNLLAINGKTNQDKGAASADEWMSPNSALHYEYVRLQTAVKSKQGLPVTQAERTVLTRAPATCERA